MFQRVVFPAILFFGLLFSLTAQAEPITFYLENSLLCIDGWENPTPIYGSFQLEYTGLVDDAFGGGINDEWYDITNLACSTSTLIFTQVSSPYNNGYDMFDAGNDFVGGGFSVVTHVTGEINGEHIDTIFQWAALGGDSFIGNKIFNDGEFLGIPGNDRVINLPVGSDGVHLYLFHIEATPTQPTATSRETWGSIKALYR